MNEWDERSYEHAEAMSGEYLGALPEQMFEWGARWQREALLADDVIERAAETMFAYSFALPDEGVKRWGSAASEVKQMHRIKARAALAAVLGIEGEQASE